MNKIGIVVLFIVFSTILGAIYGIVHDQITCSISEEYFTKFKFIQFGIEYGHFSLREGATIVGLSATWWVGLIIGLVLGPLSLIFRSIKQMRRSFTKAITLVFLLAILYSIIGYIVGATFINPANHINKVPVGVENIKDFVLVGTIHNFSYLGGLFGQLVGVFYMLRQNRKFKKLIV